MLSSLFTLTNPEIAIMMMGIFLMAVLLGFPIAFTLMAMGVGFGYYAYFDPARMDHLFDNRIFSLFVQNTYTVMDNNVLTAVPLFLNGLTFSEESIEKGFLKQPFLYF